MTTPTPLKGSVKVLDLSGSGRPAARLVVDYGPIYETLIVLTGLGSDGEAHAYAKGEVWYDEIRTALPTDVRSTLTALRGLGCKPWISLAGLVLDAPDRSDGPGVLDHIESLDQALVWAALVDGVAGGLASRHHPELLARAATGSAADRAALGAALTARHDGVRAGEAPDLEPLLRSDAASLVTAVLAVVRGAHATLVDHLAEVAPVLERDAATMRRRITGLAVDAAIEAATNGVHYTPDAGVATVLLVPQVAMRPWVLIGEQADRKLFFPAAAEESMEAGRDVPPPRLLAVCKALAEEQRLRILRRLASGSASLAQLAEHLGVAKSTVHHHTVVLRAAGLITVDLDQERDLSLRAGLVDDVGALLEAYLRRGRR